MEIKNRIKPALPHIIAVILFTVISFVYFYPVIEGKVLKANDSTVSQINSKEIQDFREKEGREPLWTNSIFSGMPAYLISTKYTGNLLRQVDYFLRMFKMPVSVLFLSMLGFYVLLLIFKVNPWLSIAGAVGYSFSSFFFLILAAGHNTQAIALAYMAPMIGGIYYAYRYDTIKGALFTAFLLALEILSNHPQITYYSGICLLVFLITEFIYSFRNRTIPKFVRTSALLIIPVVLAIGINFGSLFTFYEYGKYSIRGKSELSHENDNTTSGLNRNYIVYWSYGIGETFNLLVPDFKGGASAPFDRNSETVKVLRKNKIPVDAARKYWGTQPGTDGPHYVGAVIFFLFVLGLILIKGPEKWWLLAATILSVMLAWGKNFMPLTDLFINYFPGYNKFRAVTMALVIAQFCIPLLGFIVLRDIFNGSMQKNEILKGIKIAIGITGGLLLIFIIFPGISGSFLGQDENEYPGWLTAALISDRKDLLRSDAFRSLVFILLSTAALIGFVYKKLGKEYFIVAISLLIIFDMWPVGKRYLNAERFERPAVIRKSFTPSKADAFILNDKSYHRVLNLAVSTFNDNSPTSYFHKSIGGYHGAKLKRYQELIDTAIIRELMIFQEISGTAKTLDDFLPVFRHTNALNMLNTRYVIIEPNSPPLINSNALGNVWFVEKPVWADDANIEISSISRIDPSKEAVIDVRYKYMIKNNLFPVSENDTIELISYKPDELVYKYSCQGEKLAVFSEIYYPAGWKAFVDGKETEYFRTDYVLRGMILPEGSHEIKFTFRPASYITGNKISLASSLILFLLTAGYLVQYFRKRSKPAEK
jgi:hypothetical protein